MAKRKRRNFTPEFKGQIVLEALSGESSQAELCRRHNLSEDQLSKWKQQVVENVGSLFVSTDIGVLQNSYSVRDTPLGLNVLPA